VILCAQLASAVSLEWRDQQCLGLEWRDQQCLGLELTGVGSVAYLCHLLITSCTDVGVCINSVL